MKGVHALAVAVSSLWLFAAATGMRNMDMVRAQHVPGWPSPGIVHLYVYLPVMVLVLVLFAWACAARWRRLKVPATALIALTGLIFPVFLLIYTGGV